MKSEYQCFTDSEHHFPDVRKMVSVGLSGMNAEAREFEAKIAENVVEILEA
jgi:hypothetical protein